MNTIVIFFNSDNYLNNNIISDYLSLTNRVVILSLPFNLLLSKMFKKIPNYAHCIAEIKSRNIDCNKIEEKLMSIKFGVNTSKFTFEIKVKVG